MCVDYSWILRDGFECLLIKIQNYRNLFIFGIILLMFFFVIFMALFKSYFLLISSFFNRIILLEFFIYVSIIILFDRHFNQLLFRVLFHCTNCFSIHYTFKV